MDLSACEIESPYNWKKDALIHSDDEEDVPNKFITSTPTQIDYKSQLKH